MSLFQQPRWLRRWIRRRTNPIALDRAHLWKRRLSLFYAVVAWNAFGGVCYMIYTGRNDWAKFYGYKTDEEAQLPQAVRFAKQLNLPNAKDSPAQEHCGGESAARSDEEFLPLVHAISSMKLEFRECFYLFARSGHITTLDELTVIMRSLGLSPTIQELTQYLKKKNGRMSFADFLEVMHQHSRRWYKHLKQVTRLVAEQYQLDSYVIYFKIGAKGYLIARKNPVLSYAYSWYTLFLGTYGGFWH
uniref:EF-hand domain-containing protein n=1 Tax=Anopheles epiroticus TaxID=199890 RepID=A0A182PSR6_9DIPT